MRVDLAGFARGTKSIDHRALLEFCSRMDQLGYDGIWFNEFHFQQPPDPYPSTLILASAILACTERMRVGTSILVLPLYHPFLLAEQVAQLHIQSGGRFDLGIGRGTFPTTLAALGIPEGETRARFERSLQLMLSAWNKPTLVSEGSVWPTSTFPVGPLLPAGHSIPIYVAGSTPETIALAIEHEFPLLLSLEPNERRQLEAYDAVSGQEGGPYPPNFSISRYVMIHETRSKALTAVDDLLPRLYQRRLRFAKMQHRPVDSITLIDRDEFLSQQMIAGDPDDCVRQIKALRDATGIDSIRLIFNCNGEIPDSEADAMATLFGETALPKLHDLPALSTITEIAI